MFRLLVVLAVAFGIYWCYNTFSNFSKEETMNSWRDIKIIKTVNDGRAKIQEDAENAVNY